MAAGRRLTTDSTDDQYQIPLTDHFDQLISDDRQKIIACIPKDSCVRLAERLLADNVEKTAALNRQDVAFPASEIVDVWMRKRKSTLLILKDTLEELELRVALDALNRARYNYVSISVFFSGDIGMTHCFRNVPGLKPLTEIIRPHINRRQDATMTQRGSVQILRLDRLKELDQTLTWSSPAKSFQGQQIDISVQRRKIEEVSRHTDKAGNLEGRVGGRIERNVISWVEDDSMFFEYRDVDESSSLPISQPLESGDGKLVAGGSMIDSGFGTLSLAEDAIFGDTRHRRKEPISQPSGQFVDPSDEDTLEGHLPNEGDFVIQQIQTDGRKTLKLNVRHGRRILQYPIETQCKSGEEHFSISGETHTTTSVDQLLEYYQNDGHHLPSLPPTQVEDDLVYLKCNRVVSIAFPVHPS